MTKFVYLYTGGTMPDTPEGMEKMMGAWNAYYGGLGDRLVDGGAPFGERTCVGGGNPSSLNGYTIVEAESLDQAKQFTDGHPHLAHDGQIEVVQCQDMS